MEVRIREFDWASTPLGPIEIWPDALRFAVELCAHSPVASAVYWGPDHRLIYNDAWAPVLGDRHPALGRPAAEVWDELWPVIGTQFEEILRTGKGMIVTEQMLPMVRGDVVEETYWNYTLTPLHDGAGRVTGILNQGLEITRTLFAERRLSFQVQLADRLRRISDPEDVKRAATELLGTYLGAARVGYAEIDEEQGTVLVRGDWTRDPETASLGGHSGLISSFGREALAFLRGGEVLAIPDLRALPVGGPERTAAWEKLGVRALITVPLVREGELKALLYVHEPRARRWRRSDAAIARDAAERTWAAVERAQAEQSLRESEDHYRHTVELNPQVTWTALPDGQLNRVSNRWHAWTGTTGLGDSWAQGLHPADREATFAAWGRSVATGEPYDIEHRVRYRDGGHRWARSRAFPRYDGEGRICLWYGTTEDIHERKVGEEHQRLLINELNHRVKNTLATVQGIAFQTLKGDISVAEGRARFESRLMALSRTHNLLTEQNWGRASLERVVADALEHLAGDQGRFEVSGPPLWLTPRAALALSLALHELGTNAVKYGALSNEGGTVSIRWRVDEGRLIFEWRERGGPPVSPPASRGFGSRLIERGLETDLGGGAALMFEPEGLTCRIHAALETALAQEEGLG
jgi:PAS domain S-box-containing protein